MPIKIFCNKCKYKFYEGMPRSLYINNESSIIDHYRMSYNNQCPRCGYVFSKHTDFLIKPRGVKNGI
jgi:ribosomal protein S27AE